MCSSPKDRRLPPKFPMADRKFGRWPGDAYRDNEGVERCPNDWLRGFLVGCLLGTIVYGAIILALYTAWK